MDELGHILREARETKGLTLAEVQDKTRINARFLEAMENGEYEVLPTPVHVRGFLRNYARFLGLDPRPLLERYEFNQTKRPRPRPSSIAPVEETAVTPDKPLPIRDDQPFFDPVNMEVDVRSSGGGRETAVRLAIIAALLITLYLVGSQFIPRLFGDNSNSEALTEGINSVWQDIINREPEPEPAATDLDGPPVELEPSSVLTSTGRNIIPTPNPTRPSLPPTMETVELRLDIFERGWMEVTIDGDVVYSGIALNGDVFEWTANEEARVNSGNAIGVFVTVNGVELGRMGARGESKEEFWRTTN